MINYIRLHIITTISISIYFNIYQSIYIYINHTTNIYQHLPPTHPQVIPPASLHIPLQNASASTAGETNEQILFC